MSRADLRIFGDEDVRRAVGMGAAIASARRAFTVAERYEAHAPAPWHLNVPEHDGEIHVKGAHVVGDTTFVIKTATGFPRNSLVGLPSSTGYSTVFDAKSGFPIALLLDNGYLTELRTGAAGALIADLMTDPGIETAAVIGTGGQARFQIQGIFEVRQPHTLHVVGRSRGAVAELVTWVRERFDVNVIGTLDVARAVRAADLVVTVTNSRTPLFAADVVRPGTHVTAVGADAPGKREIPVELLYRASMVLVDDVEQSISFGELQGVDLARLHALTTIGRLVVADSAPRMERGEVSVADISGIGLQDVAIAQHALVELQAASPDEDDGPASATNGRN
jgi:ornithine cyclodeaminase